MWARTRGVDLSVFFVPRMVPWEGGGAGTRKQMNPRVGIGFSRRRHSAPRTDPPANVACPTLPRREQVARVKITQPLSRALWGCLRLRLLLVALRPLGSKHARCVPASAISFVGRFALHHVRKRWRSTRAGWQPSPQCLALESTPGRSPTPKQAPKYPIGLPCSGRAAPLAGFRVLVFTHLPCLQFEHSATQIWLFK